jgi:hypothetical protein
MNREISKDDGHMRKAHNQLPHPGKKKILKTNITAQTEVVLYLQLQIHF